MATDRHTLMALVGQQLWRIDIEPGAVGPDDVVSRRLGGLDWRGVLGLTALDGVGFAIEKASLFAIDLDSGAYERRGRAGDWRRAAALCAAGGALFAVDGGRLYRVEPESGEYTALGKPGDWVGEARSAGTASRLAHAWRGYLYRVDTQSGTWSAVEDPVELTGLTGFALQGDDAFVVFRDSLWRIALDGGARQKLGDRVWQGPSFLASSGGSLYGVTDEDLYRVDENTGDTVTLSKNRAWRGVDFVVGA